MTYKQWYEKLGIHLEDKLKEWVELMPETLEVLDVLGDPNDFIQGSLVDAHNTYTEENYHIDAQAEIQLERELLEGHCF